MTSSYKISKGDWQYLIPFFICLICFIATDVFGFLQKAKFAYWSGGLIDEPYRIITSHFIHGDAKHLLANIFGLVVARYCLQSLKLKNNFFFLLLVILLIPLQTVTFWFFDIFLFKNPISIAIGFSGILYGVDAFILLSSIYGKPDFLCLTIDLKIDREIRQTMLVLTAIGITWSLLPNISLLGHLSGFIAGSLLFLL